MTKTLSDVSFLGTIIHDMERSNNILLTPHQKRIIEAAITGTEKFKALPAGRRTGKTTVIRYLMERYESIHVIVPNMQMAREYYRSFPVNRIHVNGGLVTLMEGPDPDVVLCDEVIPDAHIGDLVRDARFIGIYTPTRDQYIGRPSPFQGEWTFEWDQIFEEKEWDEEQNA